MLDIVSKLEEKVAAIDQKMADPELLTNNKLMIELNRERRRLETTLEAGLEYRKVFQAIADAKEIISLNEDEELTEMAKEELAEHEGNFEEIEANFKLMLLPRDPDDDKPAIVEVRAGAGGDEAGIFAGDIFRMYQKFADHVGWKLEVMNSSETGVGGFKEIIFSLAGDNVYGSMKYESGVHRVQRVPATESQGRVHTSAITIAVLPEVEEVDISIKANEVKVDVYRASGPGGQSVNTTDSAVRLTHIPTGLVVTCQDEKSQIKNKAKAMKVLRARLYEIQMEEQHSKISEERKQMVSTGDRSAKIRTYNYPQSRVTDHRIGLTLYKLDEIMDGHVEYLIDALIEHDQKKKLEMQGTTQD